MSRPTASVENALSDKEAAEPTRRFSPAIDVLLTTLSARDRKVAEACDSRTSRTFPPYATLAAGLYGLSAGIEEALRAGAARDDVIAQVARTRALLSASPYVHRIQTWPRGYQGDFETVEALAAGAADRELSTPGACAEYFAQCLPITQQHRNKLVHQERLARTAMLRGDDILSVGCGGAIDLGLAAADVAGYGGTVTLIDMDADAVRLASRRLRHLSVEPLTGNVVREARRLVKGRYGLILCGGLFDYFEDRPARLLLRQLFRAMSPGGQLFLTNIATGNPYKYMMEYLCDWVLRERTENELRTMLEDTAPTGSTISLRRETTGLTILAEAAGAITCT